LQAIRLLIEAKERSMSKKSKKSAKRNAKPLSEALQGLITTCATAGFNTANAFAECVAAVQEIVRTTRLGSPRNRALEAAALGHKSGYVARSLLADPAYVKRWGNMSVEQQIEAGAEIIARASPQSSKDDRRTEQEHKACRAADVSWFKVKERAGLTEPKANKGNRKPRTGSNPPKAPPVDLVKASPKLANKAAANDYFGTAAAALLATVDKNAKLVDPRISTAVSDFLTAVKAALGIK
jgi:hypothetical protein